MDASRIASDGRAAAASARGSSPWSPRPGGRATSRLGRARIVGSSAGLLRDVRGARSVRVRQPLAPPPPFGRSPTTSATGSGASQAAREGLAAWRRAGRCVGPTSSASASASASPTATTAQRRLRASSPLACCRGASVQCGRCRAAAPHRAAPRPRPLLGSFRCRGTRGPTRVPTRARRAQRQRPPSGTRDAARPSGASRVTRVATLDRERARGNQREAVGSEPREPHSRSRSPWRAPSPVPASSWR